MRQGIIIIKMGQAPGCRLNTVPDYPIAIGVPWFGSGRSSRLGPKVLRLNREMKTTYLWTGKYSSQVRQADHVHVPYVQYFLYAFPIGHPAR